MSGRCPSCGRAGARLAPPSRSSGRIVARCEACGCHWLANPPAIDMVHEYEDNYDRAAYELYVDAKREGTVSRGYRATLDRLTILIQSDGAALFDIGAGAGDFLEEARDYGFQPHGNEFAPGAIELARERAGIDLHEGDLATIEGEDLFDAVTMWCVLAHTSDPDALLRDALRILKPGGVLFLQTPRWSAMDTAASALARASQGRFARVLDRRVNEFHMTLNSVRGLGEQVSAQGFEVIEIVPRARYTLRTADYLASLRIPAGLSRRASRVLDLAIDRDLFFRNVLDLYARKPAV